MRRFVIVGAGLAGATAAVALRREGFDGALTLVGDEPHPPYERPPLSKSYLRGETPFDDALVRPEVSYREHGIELLRAARAARLDPDRRVVELVGGDDLPYDTVLIATGARNRRPPIPGLDLDGVLALRTVEDCEAIRDRAAPGRSVVVGGLGFIGAEVAASLRQRGLEVTCVASRPPLESVFGPTISRVLEQVHRDHGVRLVLGDVVASFEGSAVVEAVVTASGRRFPCDLAVIATGVEPATELVAGSAIAVDDGIVVDERCRSNVPDVFACGDVAMHPRPLFGRRLRIEHWDHARRHGRAAALSMLGKGSAFDGVPWFWSDQYDVELQYAGYHTGADRAVIRGEPSDRRFSAFFLDAGKVRAAMSFNRSQDVRDATPLIEAGSPVEPETLRDEGVALRSLVAGRAP